MAHGTVTDHEYADSPEALTPDNTIGVISTQEEIEGDGLFDLRRLRETIVQYDMYYDERNAEIAIRTVDHGDKTGTVLVMVPPTDDPTHEAVALASCIPSEEA